MSQIKRQEIKRKGFLLSKIPYLVFIGLIALLILMVSWSPIESNSESVIRGKTLYNSNCMACHMTKGEGIRGVFPPLAQSDYLMSDISRAATIVLQGKSGEIEVNGTKYYGMMTGFSFSDQELADVINYINNSWGNEAQEINAEWANNLKNTLQ